MFRRPFRDCLVFVEPTQDSVPGYFRPPNFVAQWARFVQIRGIPHLAKNERDVGHPRFCYWDKGLLHHDGSASAWPILIEQEGQGDHQGRGKGKNVVHVDVGESLRLCLKLLI